VEITELRIPDALVLSPQQYFDSRGVFLEWFKAENLEAATGRKFQVRQANTSVSSKGVVRGIHYAQLPEGQAKYVTCLRGSVLDFVVDIRLGSPTFGLAESVLLDDVDCKALFIPEGLGHMFVALTDDAVVSYLVNQPFNPGREKAINPLDAQLDIAFPFDSTGLVLSEKDVSAPSLSENAAQGTLPTWAECQAAYRIDGKTN
jgi:dTDP-4-dehydrorhamnose 3,5-epimerase